MWVWFHRDWHRWRYIKAEAPCWKGEIVVGFVTVIWERASKETV